MKTNDVYISNNGVGRDEALAEAEKYADYQNITGRNKTHIRLLTEELMGMVETIAGSFFAYFWIEDHDDEYQLHIKAKIDMDSQKRDALLDASTSGKNIAAKGIMGKLRNVFQTYWSGYGNVMATALSQPYNEYLIYGVSTSTVIDSASIWRLSQYKETVAENQSGGKDLDEWDELEKSIIANLADDVSVGINGDSVEMIVTKKLS